MSTARRLGFVPAALRRVLAGSAGAGAGKATGTAVLRCLQAPLPDGFGTEVAGAEDEVAGDKRQYDEHHPQRAEDRLGAEQLIDDAQAGGYAAGDPPGSKGENEHGGEQHVDDREDVRGLRVFGDEL